KHALAHVRYLQMRGGDDRDHAIGRKRLFIDAKREAIGGEEVNARIRSMKESGVICHRIVLSPGIDGVDMNHYTRSIMSELGSAKGTDFEYYATEHKNTDHDHTHVIVLGLDQYGRQVRLTKNDYKTVREAGDRYLERFHPFDRFLDKKMHVLMRDGYKRDRGDQSFESLLEDFKDPRNKESDDQLRETSPGLSQELSIDALPENERIVCDRVVYTKYSSLEDLLELDRKLVSGELHRLPEDQYQQMWSWIGKKKQFGDDYYVRAAEPDRMQQLFDEELKRSLRTDNSPPKSFKQYVFESTGRLLEFHEKYEINTQRSQLQKHIEQLDQSGCEDLEKRNGLIEQLEWLDAMAEERIESRKEIPIVQRSTEDENSIRKFAPLENSSAVPERSENDLPERSRFGNKNHNESHSPIDKVLFGEEASIHLTQYEKTEEEVRIDLWPKLAFDPEHNCHLLLRDDLNDKTGSHVRREEDRLLGQILEQQVHQTFLEHVKEGFRPDQLRVRTEEAQNKDDKENEREDTGREHTR
ncbi:MAG: hypothetical protein HYX67_00865, partial [Candidatus Melainabacteria bacterium]|nr:hypothetical protein [Candidatus Melainabacteria bacterium]